jgi:hypothetical protein
MGSRRPLTVLAIALAAAGLAACDDDEAKAPEGGEDYALEVERITDSVSEDVGASLTTLNRLADGGIDAERAAPRLDEASRATHDAAARLAELSPPEAASGPASDLGGSLSDLARAFDSAAIDARATERGFSTPADVGRAQAQVVLAYSSGVGALSRAVRALAVAPAPAS